MKIRIRKVLGEKPCWEDLCAAEGNWPAGTPRPSCRTIRGGENVRLDPQPGVLRRRPHRLGCRISGAVECASAPDREGQIVLSAGGVLVGSARSACALYQPAQMTTLRFNGALVGIVFACAQPPHQPCARIPTFMGNTHEGWDQSPARHLATNSAKARARCELACFLAGSISPNVSDAPSGRNIGS